VSEREVELRQGNGPAHAKEPGIEAGQERYAGGDQEQDARRRDRLAREHEETLSGLR
jgi:hypothetical protein